MRVVLPPPLADRFRKVVAHVAKDVRAGRALLKEYDVVLAERIASAYECIAACIEEDASHVAPKDNGAPDLQIADMLERIVAQDPDNDVARWGIIAPEILFADNDFACRHLEMLALRDAANVRWLCASAAWVLITSGVDSTSTLRASLLRVAIASPSLNDRLAEMRRSHDAHLRLMASVAESVLDGQMLSDLPI